MLEALIALAILALLVGSVLVGSVIPWELVFGGGLLLVALGLLVGVPAGAYYHVQLYRALRPRKLVPRRWWLRPFALHVSLTDDERRRVLPWFYLGAFGFIASILGCVLFAVGAVRSN
jgi:hypothetical protein